MTGRNDEVADGSIPDTPLTREEFAEYLAMRTQELLARVFPAQGTQRLAAIKQIVAGAKVEQSRRTAGRRRPTGPH